MAKGTIVQKILQKHLVSGRMEPGSQISIRIDQTLTQDATGTMAYMQFEAMGIGRVKTELSVSYIDHNTQQTGSENRNDHMYLQTIAASKGVHFSPPGNGICHQVHLERFGIPGCTLLGSDSHTPTNGGIGMLAIGAGGLDVALAMAGQAFRLAFPKIIGVKLTGELKPWVCAKDVILKVLEILKTKGNVGCIIEYFGDGVKTLSVPERATITNMGAELGVTTSIFPSDKKTREFLKAQKREGSWTKLVPSRNVEYDRVLEINLGELEPLAACPSSPDNIRTVASLKGTKVHQVIIGSCTNSSYMDLCLVADVLKGRVVNNNVSLAIAPGSRQVMEMLARNNRLADIIASGARILETVCGPCIGVGQSPADETVSVRTFNRNFAGRSGTANDKVYVVSPATAVACALTGEFTDPRELGIEFPERKSTKKFLINDNMIIKPIEPEEAIKQEIIRKPTLSMLPRNKELPQAIDGRVIIKVGDKVTTDHIMPAGKHLKLRSNIPAYSKVVFECYTVAGKPSFAERAAEVRDAGFHGIIVAGDSYGQGSSREHAAICPMYLGIKAVIAMAIERIHSANLVNFGIIPLLFENPGDYVKIEQGDEIKIADIRNNLKQGVPVQVKIVKPEGPSISIGLKHNLNDEDIAIILAGGRLNVK